MSKKSSAMSLPSPYLELILGPMFSGKTTRLIEHYKAYTFIGKKIVVLNYSLDVRYSSVALSSHDRVEIPCVFSRTLDKALWQDADVILINEGQQIVADLRVRQTDIAHAVVTNQRCRMTIQAIVDKQSGTILQGGQVTATIRCPVQRKACIGSNSDHRRQHQYRH